MTNILLGWLTYDAVREVNSFCVATAGCAWKIVRIATIHASLFPLSLGEAGNENTIVPGTRRDSSIGEMYNSIFTHEIWVDVRFINFYIGSISSIQVTGVGARKTFGAFLGLPKTITLCGQPSSACLKSRCTHDVVPQKYGFPFAHPPRVIRSSSL